MCYTMTRASFITKFLIPSLDDGRFGPRLEWVDRKAGVFQLQWNHKAEQAWTEYDAQVFTEWDKMKGHYEPSKKGYYSRSKQRFRALLYKFTNEQLLRKVESSDKKFHRFCIVQTSGKKIKSSTHEKEVISLEEGEMMDFDSLWNGDLNQSTGDSEKENFQMNFHALFKDHMYSTDVKDPQLKDAEDPFWSGVQWDMSQLSPNHHSVYDAFLIHPYCSDFCCFDENHLHGSLNDSVHVELTILPDAESTL